MLEFLLLGQVADETRRHGRKSLDDDRVRRDDHREHRAVSSKTRYLPGAVLRVVVPTRRDRLQVRRQVVAEIFRQQHAAGFSDDLPGRPAEHPLGRRIERKHATVGSDREDPLGGVLHDRTVQRFAARDLLVRLGEQIFCLLLALADRAGHDDHDPEREHAQEPERLRRDPGQVRRREPLVDEKLSDGTADDRPAEHGSPRCRARLLQVDERRVHEAHTQRGPPPGQVDHRHHRRRVHEHPHVQSPRTARRIDPTIELRIHRRGADDGERVRPPRFVRDEPELPQHQHQE